MKLRLAQAFATGAVIGVLGGLIGLGGAEFRLPLLVGLFGFPPLEAIILNKATSLVVVASALPFRAGTVPFSTLLAGWPVIVNLLAGSLVGAWFGAGLATRLSAAALHRVIAVLLAGIALVLLLGHHPESRSTAALTGAALVAAGVLAGFLIGVVSSLLGVAGGELLIPTLILLFGVEVKVAGSFSLAVSLPTMLAAFTRYSRDQSFVVLRRNRLFVLAMAAGSLLGTFVGGRLLGVIPDRVLLPMLSLILMISAVRSWQHGRAEPAAAHSPAAVDEA